MKPLLFLTIAAAAHAATPVSDITVPPGFKVELLREAGEREGSWISMALDAEGRIYISPQGSIPESGLAKDSKWGGLWRSTVIGEKVTAWEKVPVPVGDSMGMLWAFDSLYVSGNGPEGRGIYRCKDTDGDSLPDSAVMWKKVPGGSGEHGAHALVLSPDKKNIYIVHGNATGLIDGIAPDSPYRNWGEDDLLPKLKDPTATFFDSIKAPYGYVVRTDEAGEKWELIAGGFRNPYDIAFNADGELFTYDSDMEWDRGLPWYRPTRVLHIVPGGEYGFREGSAKMPADYPDTLPAAVDIGLGCPTGVKFGTTATGWPDKYRTAFFACDWTYGRILAVHMKEKGASYTATNPLKSTTFPKDAESSADVEPFVVGKGMPVTDVEFLKDGSMVFTTGGRGTSAGLYRVSWVGEEQPETPEQKIARIVGESDRIVQAGIRRAVRAALANATLTVTKSPFTDEPLVSLETLGGTDSVEASMAMLLIQPRLSEEVCSTLLSTINPPESKPVRINLPRDPGALREMLTAVEKDMDGAEGRSRFELEIKRSAIRAALKSLGETVPAERPLPLPLSIREKHNEAEASKTEKEKAEEEIEKLKDQLKDAQKADDRKKVMELDMRITSARIDLEYPVSQVFRTDVRSSELRALFLVARSDYRALQEKTLAALAKFPLKDLPDDLKLLKLRILQLTFARHGRPSEEWQKLGLEKLLASYPATFGVPPLGGINRDLTSDSPKKEADSKNVQSIPPKGGTPNAQALNRELSQLLVWLSQPELGDENTAAAPKTKVDGSEKQSDSKGKIFEPLPDSLGKQPDSLGKRPDSLGKQPDSLGKRPDSLGKQPDSLVLTCKSSHIYSLGSFVRH